MRALLEVFGIHGSGVRFLRERRVQAVIAGHVGDAMVPMLEKLGMQVHLGASGDTWVAIRAIQPRER